VHLEVINLSFGLLIQEKLGTQTALMAVNSNFLMNMKFQATVLQQLFFCVYFQLSIKKNDIATIISTIQFCI